MFAELQREPQRYRSVLLPGEGEFFATNGLLYLPTAEIESLVEQLAAAQPLLGLLAARFDGAAVLDVTRRTLAGGAQADREALGSFYAALERSLGAAASGVAEPLDWRGLLAVGAAPTTRRIIVLQPELDFSRLQPAAEAIAGIRALAARLEATAAAPVSVRLTGSLAMEHEELLSVGRGAGLGALATFIMVGLVLFAALRSWRLLAIALVTLLVGLTLTATFAAAAVGQLNLLSVAFVVLNVGLGSDYVIGGPGDVRRPRRNHAWRGFITRTLRDHDGRRVLLVHSDDVFRRFRARPHRGHGRVLRAVRERDAIAGPRRLVG
jgi:hypothetical protein